MPWLASGRTGRRSLTVVTRRVARVTWAGTGLKTELFAEFLDQRVLDPRNRRFHHRQRERHTFFDGPLSLNLSGLFHSRLPVEERSLDCSRDMFFRLHFRLVATYEDCKASTNFPLK